MITILIALIVITPLCGYLFNCGCTWPWEGLADDCNYFDQTADESCPWCASNWAGAMSVAASFVSGYLLSMSEWKSSVLPENKYDEIFIRTLFGLVFFIIVAAGTAWISAELQHYRYFVFSNGYIPMNQYNREPMTIDCPYCGESIDTLIDFSSEPQEYYEDCSVCCAPIRFMLTLNQMSGELNVQVCRDDD